MAELPWVKSFVHLTAVALMALQDQSSCKYKISNILFMQIEKEDAAEERIN